MIKYGKERIKMPEGTNDVPEFTKNIDNKPITPDEAQAAKKSWREEMEEVSQSADEKLDEDAEKLRKKQERGKIIAGAGVAAAVVGGGGVLAPEIISHITEVKIDDGAYLSGLKNNNPEVLKNVIQNRTVEAVGQEAWDSMSSEERLEATGEMSVKVYDAIEEYEKENPVKTDDNGNMEVSFNDPNTDEEVHYKTDFKS